MAWYLFLNRLFLEVKPFFKTFSFTAFSKQTKVGNQEYNLHLVDTAGQDEYSIIPQSYFININGYVLVYSVNSAKRLVCILLLNEYSD